jgi:hypothetical protein
VKRVGSEPFATIDLAPGNEGLAKNDNGGQKMLAAIHRAR